MTGKIKKILLLSLILIVGSLMISTASAATTWNISSTATNADIQDIINNDATDGDTLNFYAGANYSYINLNINKSLDLQGNGAILNNAVQNTIVLNVVNTNNVVIDSFNIYGGRAIVANTVDSLTISNNVIIVSTPNDTAIALTSVQNAEIATNTLIGTGGRDGIGLVNSSDITIQYNNISGFTRNGISLAAGMGGIGTSTFDVLIQENSISSISEEGIFFGGGVFQVDILNNNISNIPGNGINIARSTTDILIQGNIITYCGVGIRIEENNTFHNVSSPTVLNNVSIINNTIVDNDIGVLLVNLSDPDWWTTYLNSNNIIKDNIDGNIEVIIN